MMRGCSNEEAVRLAAVRNEWPDELRAHTRACAACADVALVTSALRDLRPAPIVTRDAGVLWICARQARRLVTEARLSLAIMAITTIAATAVLAVMLSFVDWRGFWSTLTSAELSAATGVTVAAGTLIAAALLRGRRVSQE
jgi:hypothetical protein